MNDSKTAFVPYPGDGVDATRKEKRSLTKIIQRKVDDVQSDLETILNELQPLRRKVQQ